MNPLVQQAFHTHTLIYKRWFPCKMGWNNDPSPIRLRLQPTYWKLIPWYFITWVMIFGASFGSIAFVLIREVFQPTSRLTAIHFAISFCIGVLTLISWGVCIAFHAYWFEVVSAFNQLSTFAEEWTNEQADTYPRPKLYYLRIWKCSTEELTGMVLIIITINTSLVCVPGAVIFGCVSNLDMYYPILEDYFLPSIEERSALVNVCQLIGRIIFGFICVIELCRFTLVTLFLTSTIALLIEKLMSVILKTESLDEAFHKYQLLWLQYQIIKIPFNNVLAIGSVIGFFCGTTLIWLSFNAWNYVPLFLAMMYPTMAIFMLILLLVGISAQVSIVEKSNSFIYKWKKNCLLKVGIRMTKETRRCKMLGRTLRSLPVACSSCCSIDSKTPFSFLQILMKAVTDSLLGIKM